MLFFNKWNLLAIRKLIKICWRIGKRNLVDYISRYRRRYTELIFLDVVDEDEGTISNLYVDITYVTKSMHATPQPIAIASSGNAELDGVYFDRDDKRDFVYSKFEVLLDRRFRQRIVLSHWKFAVYSFLSIRNFNKLDASTQRVNFSWFSTYFQCFSWRKLSWIQSSYILH